jgi:hypothetical protein
MAAWDEWFRTPILNSPPVAENVQRGIGVRFIPETYSASRQRIRARRSIRIRSLAMNTQLRWIAAAVAALAVGQVSAQGYYPNPNYVRGDGYGNGYTHVVRCESYNGRSKFCRVNAQGRVFIARQLSQQRCMRGRNWNADYRGIWVGGGCRADFAIAPGRGYRQGGGYAGQYNGPGGYAAQYNGPGGYAGNPYAGNPGRNSNSDYGYYNNGSRDAYRADANRDAGYNDPRYAIQDPRNGTQDPRNRNYDPRNGNNDPRAMNNSRYDDRGGDQDADDQPEDQGYSNPPQH